MYATGRGGDVMKRKCAVAASIYTRHKQTSANQDPSDIDHTNPNASSPFTLFLHYIPYQWSICQYDTLYSTNRHSLFEVARKERNSG